MRMELSIRTKFLRVYLHVGLYVIKRMLPASRPDVPKDKRLDEVTGYS